MRILILCTGNSARSQMAEAILREIDPAAEVFSAGTEPAARVNPLAVEAMREVGLDISGARPKSVEGFLTQSFDTVITVCDHAHETCPVFAGRVGRRLHMGFRDPVTAEDFREVRDQIRERFAAWHRTGK
jgi:arsenate reductase